MSCGRLRTDGEAHTLLSWDHPKSSTFPIGLQGICLQVFWVTGGHGGFLKCPGKIARNIRPLAQIDPALEKGPK